MTSPTIELAQSLIRQASVTPDDAGCQQIMIERLKAIGFEITPLRFGDVDNFWATRGNSGDILCFAGHTDVVPEGDPEQWKHKPYEATLDNGILHGRGAADMKGSLAAMVVAVEEFVKNNPDHYQQIAFLITSDEEGIAVDGTVKVVEYLEKNNIKIKWCIVGEPSSTNTTGDIIKNGRRGSLGLTLTINGVQGHVAYPHLARNPIHEASPALAELATIEWDKGNDFFPPTTFQISNMNSGTGATNVIPGSVDIIANFRFSTELTVENIQQRFITILDKHNLDYEIRWQVNGLPFLTQPGNLTEAVSDAIKEVTDIKTELSTAGGTSDARFIAPTGTQVIELGPVNATIHQVDEQVNAEELNLLKDIYLKTLEKMLK